LSFTGFNTDSSDISKEVWDKVFLNLEDFGIGFAKRRPAVPTVYGPILFRFNPNALLEAIDVAVCTRSAGAPGFDREAESLSTI